MDTPEFFTGFEGRGYLRKALVFFNFQALRVFCPASLRGYSARTSTAFWHVYLLPRRFGRFDEWDETVRNEDEVQGPR